MSWPLAIQRYREDLFLRRSKPQVIYEAFDDEYVEADEEDNMEMNPGVFNNGGRVWGLFLGSRFFYFVWTVDQSKSDDSMVYIDGARCVGVPCVEDGKMSPLGNTGLAAKDIIDSGIFFRCVVTDIV